LLQVSEDRSSVVVGAALAAGWWHPRWWDGTWQDNTSHCFSRRPSS